MIEKIVLNGKTTWKKVMIEKIEAYKTKDGMIFPKEDVEEIIVYVTEDGKTFTDKICADAHLNVLENKKKLVKTVEKVKQLFKEELAVYANDTKEYSAITLKGMDLECDFWDEESRALADTTNTDIAIENFSEYVSLVKALLEDFYLEEAIKIVKKIICKETV